jgi:hypothetical protein
LARRSCGFGEGSAQEQSVVGARLQALAEPDAVVIAAGTHRLIGDLFDYRDLGAVDVKWIAAPVPAWQALRPSVVVSRFEALRGSALTRLVGREEEIDLMLRRWARAKAGDGQVVLISGEAGLGKSRLTAALVERSTPSHISACAISARPIIRTAHCSHSLTSSTGRRGLSAMICLRPNWGRSKPCWLTPLAQTKTWRFSRTFCPYRRGSGTRCPNSARSERANTGGADPPARKSGARTAGARGVRGRWKPNHRTSWTVSPSSSRNIMRRPARQRKPLVTG